MIVKPAQPTIPSAPMGQTAKLAWATLGLQFFCLIIVLSIYLLEHSNPELVAEALEPLGLTARMAISTIGSIAIGGGVGGGMVTAGVGMRHYGTAAPTSSQLYVRAHQTPIPNPPDADADATVPS